MRRIDRLRPLAGATAAVALGLLVAAGAGGQVSSGAAWTVAGNGDSGNSGDGDQATEAQIDRPRSIFATSDGGFVWAQPWSNRVRKVGPDGVISTVAGTGAAGFSGDGGSATAATLNFVHSAAPTVDGGLLLADELNNRIRKISAGGVISTVAGTGGQGYSGDGGPATAAQINNPRGVVGLPDGGFLIPDSNNHRVRRVFPNGVITTVAGTGVQGFSGDGGQATAAQLSVPFGVAPTAEGGFLIVDVGNQRIRKVSPSGIITTVAGTGVSGYSGDGGPATAAQLSNPHNVVEQSDGGILIADTTNARIRRVAPNGVITTVAGTGVSGFGGDGSPATAAQLSAPKAVALTAESDALIADEQNNRIRFVGTIVAPGNTAPPTIAGTPQTGRTLTAWAGGWSGTGPGVAYQWSRCASDGTGCFDVTGATAKTYALTGADVGASIRVRVRGSNVAGSASATSAATAAVSDAGTPPVNQTPPTISGTPQDGQTLTASPGTWTGTAPITFAYRWRRCNGAGAGCSDIAGATAATYGVTSADIASTLRVRVTATNGSTASAYSNAVLNDAPRSYWRFDEVTGPLVDARGFKDGSYVNSPQRGISGLIEGDGNSAVSLNGVNQYVDVPGDPLWTPGSFSIEIIVKPSELPSNKTIWSTQGLFTGWWLNTDVNGVVRMFVGNGSSWQYNPAGPVLQAGTRYHLLATYDGTNTRMYVDGTLVSTGPNATMASNGGANIMRFGAYSTGPGQYWPGVLDEASFYPVVLTAGQVLAHYEASVNGSTATSAATAAVTAAPPVNSALPVVSGVAEVGRTLSASSGSWSGTAPISYAYQWRRCDSAGGACVDVGANASSYLLTGADVGSRMRVVVTASNGAGSSSATSAATAVVVAQPSSGTLTFSVVGGADDGDAWLVAPQASGYPPVGTASYLDSRSFLTVARRAVFGDYQVFVGLLRFDTSALPDGATVTSASLKLDLLGKIDADNRGLEAEWYSASSWPIDAADWSLASSGSASAAVDITALSTSATSSFELAGLGSISTTGSTGLRLHLSGGQPSGDNLLQVASLEHSTRPEPQLVVSYTTAAPVAPSNTGLPVVSGVAEVGRTLSASSGSWSGTAPISYAYQWRRCDSAGGACVDVGANASSYLLTGADVGSRMRVVVTASNGAGSSSATSAATAVVVAQPSSGTLTFSVVGGADDGDAWLVAPQASGYPPVGTASYLDSRSFLTVARRAVFGDYQVFVGLLRFDTSALPDGATVTSASLKLDLLGKIDADNRGLEAEWYSASSWPIDAADWSLASSGSASAAVDITALSTSATSSFELAGLGSISTTGSTGLRLHLSGGQPSGDNLLQVASLEHSTRPEPQLVVSYTTAAPVAPSNTGLPVVSGVAEVGRTLSASSGSWSGTAPISYAYQWRRCDSAGGACVDVGANASSYLLTGADVGSRMRVVVTASNGAGSSSATSAATAVVVAQPSSGTLTFSVVGGADDGDAWLVAPQASGYPPVGTASYLDSRSFLTVARRAVFGDYQVFVGLLRFDTSALPDGATVTSASLKLDLLGKIDADNRGLEAEWYSASSWPIDAADWSLASSGSASAAVDITALSTSATSSFELAGLGSISTTGSTGLRLHLSGGQPSGDNLLQVASLEHSTRPEPQLVVSYTTAAP